MKQTDGTVYAKLLMMAREEAEGRKDVKLKEICRGIAKRFRLNNKEVLAALKDVTGSQFGKLDGRNFHFGK